MCKIFVLKYDSNSKLDFMEKQRCQKNLTEPTKMDFSAWAWM